MNPPSTVTTNHRLCLRSILAGTFVAVSIHLLLTMLGAGITSLVAKPSTNDAPAQTLTIGLALSWTVSALVSLWIGGFVAGKVGAPGDEEDGKLHGFMVWSFTTVIAFVLLAAGIGKALNVAGQAVAGAGKVAAEAVPSLVEKSAGVIDEYTGEVTVDGKPVPPAAKREIAVSLKNFLMNGETGRTPQNRDALIAAVAKNTKLTPEEAAKMVDEWSVSYDRAAAEVKAAADAALAMAKEAADRTARATGAAAIWTFIAFWIGAITAAWGGKCGALGCRRITRVEGSPVSRTVHA